MSKNTDKYIGKIYGKLTVLSCNQNISPYYYTYLNCICDCGNKITKSKGVVFRMIRKGQEPSCGCSHITVGICNKGKFLPDKSKTKIGEKYNKLTILDTVPFINKSGKRKGYKFLCLCDCGNKTEQIYANLKSGKVKSCGCYQKELASITGSITGLNNYKNEYKWYFIKDGVKTKCRSGYEVLYANWLIKNNIEFLYEPKCFKLNKKQRYTPDFYLINEKKYIEIKGSFKNGNNLLQEQKIELFKENFNCEVKFWDDIFIDCNLPFKTYVTYFRNAKKHNVSIEDYFVSV